MVRDVTQELAELKALPLGTKPQSEIEDLEENVSDCTAALQQQQKTQCTLLEKQLRLLGIMLNERTKQRNFEVSEAKKFVSYQSDVLKKREKELHEQEHWCVCYCLRVNGLVDSIPLLQPG